MMLKNTLSEQHVNCFNSPVPALEKGPFSNASVWNASADEILPFPNGDKPKHLSVQDSRMPQVALLLCTYQGQDYLSEQLESFARQSYANWKIYASDDHSSDSTHSILEKYRSIWGNERIALHAGPGKGCTANFLSLICCDQIRSDYYAYSDQDDIWEADKLERAMNWFATLSSDKPALYCSRTRIVSEDNREIGLSPLFLKPPAFANALTQNIAGGNTMILNHAARELLAEASKNADVVLHDWWTYIVISGCGGEVFYDPYPTLRYRQHDTNLVGGGIGWFARFDRIVKLWDMQWKNWNDKHIAALGKMSTKLTPENKEIFDRFCAARQNSMIPRLAGIIRCGLYRQTLQGNLGLMVAAIFNRL